MLRKNQSSFESFEDTVASDYYGNNHDEDDEFDNDDDRPESVRDVVRRKEMRKGIDLATTLERIEKNFVITDPRLPDNPIVRSMVILTLVMKFNIFL